MLDIENFKEMLSEKLGIERAMLKNDASFLDDLGVDSLSMANFIIKMERKFKVKVELDNIWKLGTVEEAYTFFLETINRNKN